MNPPKTFYNTRELTEDQVEALIDDLVSIEVKQGTWRWGHITTYVAKLDGKYWKFTVQYHSQDGPQLCGTTTATEVRPQEKTVIDWVPVAKDGPEML